MPGDIKRKQGAAVTGLDGGSSTAISNNSYALCANTFDNRTNADESAIFTLVSAFGSAVSILQPIAMFLVPAIDGSPTWPDVDTASTPPTISLPFFAGNFVTPINSASSQKISLTVRGLEPMLYRVYLVNATGQQMSAGWTLQLQANRSQYTS